MKNARHFAGPCARSAVLLACSATLAMAAAPDQAIVQGLYEGTWKDAAGTLPVEVRVVALADKKFTLLARRKLADGGIERAEIPGTTVGEQVGFMGDREGVAWNAVYADGAIKGSIGDTGGLDIRRVERKPPSLGKKPPPGAVVLLDGRNFTELERCDKAPWHVGDMSKDGWRVWEIGLQFSGAKEPSVWPTPENPLPDGWAMVPARRKVGTVVGIDADGSIAVPRQGMTSTRSFEGSYDLHVEFMCELKAGSRSQGRCNSGVYATDGEIQVLDSFGMATEPMAGCGAIYNRRDPDCMEPIPSRKGQRDNSFTLASLPPQQWQTFDVELRVKQPDKGRAKGALTVFHNGIKVHDAQPVSPAAVRFHIQEHGDGVRFRNIWVMPIAP